MSFSQERCLVVKSMLTKPEYMALANFRYAVGQFMALSQREARKHGMTARQHQALLAILTAEPDRATIGYLAKRLFLKPNSTSDLADRLEAIGLVIKTIPESDRRQALLGLTPKAHLILSELGAAHRDELGRMRPLLQTLLDGLSDA